MSVRSLPVGRRLRRLLLGLLATALVPLCACPVSRAIFTEPLPSEAEFHLARTKDGMDLGVVHYPPQGEPRKVPPLVLCHGISANARHMDLDGAHSLARWFAARGVDAWVMSLRGTWDGQLPPQAVRSSPSISETSIDTYADYDLPAVFDLVRKRTGAAQVDYVAHSMGGLVLYAYLVRGGDAVRAAVTLGSPARLRFGGKLEPWVRENHDLLLRYVSSVPNDLGAPLYFPLDGLETPLEHLVMNPENVTQDVWHRLIVTGTAPMAGGVLRQFAKGIADDRFESADGKVDYLEGLKAVKTPILFVAGKQDRIALADGVKAAYRSLGGDKKFFMAGVENGMAYDYSHLDMLVGERAPQELWPELLAWYEAHP